MKNSKKKFRHKIALALGAGSARGWSHIGVIRALKEIGIEPDIVCGTSIGALVGAAYCAGNLDKLEQWLKSLRKLDVARFFNFNWNFNGFIDSDRLEKFLAEYVCSRDRNIEHLDKTFAAVSTDLGTGREIWFTEGPVVDAVWASISLPGLFPPVQNESRWLVDGGLVNPVPVSLCRAKGADIVIAVSLTGNISGKVFKRKKLESSESAGRQVEKKKPDRNNNFADKIVNSVKEYSASIFQDDKREDDPPGLYDAIAGSIHITQERITRSRMAGEPPEFLLTPHVSDIGLLEFNRASEAIKAGEQSVQRLESELKVILEQ